MTTLNVPHSQVTGLLIPLAGDPLGSEASSGLLTSSFGLGGGVENGVATKALIESAVMDVWGSCTTATCFAESWFEAPRSDLEKAGLLTEFFKHVDVGACAAITIEAALDDGSGLLAETDATIGTYLDESNYFETNGIRSVRTLNDLLLYTGVLHGTTLSFTRLAAVPEIFMHRNIDDLYWAAGDAFSQTVALGTIIGVQPEKAVLGSKVYKSGALDGPGKVVEDMTIGPLQQVLEEYDAKLEVMKKVYCDKIKQRDDFLEYGFLLTDYCPDYVDGKQLTLATYI